MRPIKFRAWDKERKLMRDVISVGLQGGVSWVKGEDYGYDGNGENYVDIPVGMTIDHLCRNRICINPLHLELVTLKENILRSNGVSAIYARRTSCKRGHLFTVGNIGKRRSGRRCLACHREDARNRRIK